MEVCGDARKCAAVCGDTVRCGRSAGGVKAGKWCCSRDERRVWDHEVEKSSTTRSVEQLRHVCARPVTLPHPTTQLEGGPLLSRHLQSTCSSASRPAILPVCWPMRWVSVK